MWEIEAERNAAEVRLCPCMCFDMTFFCSVQVLGRKGSWYRGTVVSVESKGNRGDRDRWEGLQIRWRQLEQRSAPREHVEVRKPGARLRCDIARVCVEDSFFPTCK
jgi:hypothetical protein